jgi:uncharacterized protein YeaO (DUF488 family)
MIKIKRAYDAPDTGDGRRVLVDRLWPRGLAKEKAHIDEWQKELAPSAELRTWFGHDPEKWQEFRRRYNDELSAHRELLESLKKEGKRETVTLLFAAKDGEHNNAVVLKEKLEERT